MRFRLSRQDWKGLLWWLAIGASAWAAAEVLVTFVSLS